MIICRKERGDSNKCKKACFLPSLFFTEKKTFVAKIKLHKTFSHHECLTVSFLSVTLWLLMVRSSSGKGHAEWLRVKLLTYILWFHADVLTELLHGLWAEHLVGGSVLVEPGKALLTGKGLVSVDWPRTADQRSGKTSAQTKHFKDKCAAITSGGCYMAAIQQLDYSQSKNTTKDFTLWELG